MAWLQSMWRNDGLDEETQEASVGLMQPSDFTLAEKDGTQSGRGRRFSYMGLIGLLIVSNAFWMAVVMGLWKVGDCSQRIHATDFVSAHPLPWEPATIEFDDLLLWNSTSNEVYRAMDPSLPLYFGKPSPAMDAAWKDLMRFEYPAITREELALNPTLSFGPGDRHPVTSQHHIALDVFHNLHCLNAVRKALDTDYYGAHGHGQGGRADGGAHESHSGVAAAQREHIDHCLNHVRQALQCRPDFSPAAMQVVTDTDGAQFFVGNARRHSCYDWSSVVAWAEARAVAPGYVPEGGE
ncbi:hypothetical protein ACEQ8H_002271 [Pleosporales sp. CAS-2024a]